MSFYNRFRAGGQLGSGSSSYMSGFRSGGSLGEDDGGGSGKAKEASPVTKPDNDGGKKETHSISNSMSYLEVNLKIEAAMQSNSSILSLCICFSIPFH